MSIKAFILVTTDASSSAEVARRIRDVDGVTDAVEVMGPYDIVATIELNELSEISHAVSNQIRKIAGVATTLTCVTMP